MILIPTLLFIFPAVFVILLAPAVFQVMAVFGRRGSTPNDRREDPDANADAGAVAVELALTLFLVIVPMLLGIWEIGCLLNAQQTLVEAVREGGRQASTGTDDRRPGPAGRASVPEQRRGEHRQRGRDRNQHGRRRRCLAGHAARPPDRLGDLAVHQRRLDMTSQYVPDSSILTTSCQWYSLKEPLTPCLDRPDSVTRPTRGRPIGRTRR